MKLGAVLPMTRPGDILVHLHTNPYLFGAIEEWGLGSPFTHVSMVWHKNPYLLYESCGRGVGLVSPSRREHEDVVVLRLKRLYRDLIPVVLHNALVIASDPGSKYDHRGVMAFIVPRLICTKLGLPQLVPYVRDRALVCSEAITECFWRKPGAPYFPWYIPLKILPWSRIPLPADFLTSPLLEVAYA